VAISSGGLTGEVMTDSSEEVKRIIEKALK